MEKGLGIEGLRRRADLGLAKPGDHAQFSLTMTDLRDELQRTLGDTYTLERELGGGGMSRVFVAEDNALGRKVVVKVLSPDLTAGVNVDRFKREIQLAARLLQAQIVPVLAAGELAGVPYYTMPFVEGESLRKRLARTGALPIPEVVSILRDVTRALAYAHERGVVHRDIKPDNVLLSGGTAVVTDFGIAKALTAAKNDAPSADVSLTQFGTSVGTPAYISPEQAAGDPNVDHRADIYSLGCMAYELLTGQPPFAGRSPQRTLAAHLTETPRPIEEIRPDVPPALGALVMRCLEKEPSARPQSAAEIGASLDGVPSGASSAAQLTGPGATTRAFLWYAVALAAVAIVAKAAVVGIGVPDWVFTGAVGLMVLVLVLVVVAAWTHRTTRHVTGQTPVRTPASAATQSTMTTVALRANRYLTWRRVFRASAIAVLSFAIAVIGVMVLRGFGVGPAASLLAAGRLHGRERLLITDFAAGKDSSLSHVVTEAVRTNLSQSKAVSIMPPTAIAAALQRMQRPASGPIDVALGREIALREGVKALVGGSVTPLGSGYVVSIRLISTDSGNDLAAFQKTVNGTSELLDAIDQLTRKLRGRIGESLKSVREAPALDQVTTSSLEALRLYAEASRASDLEGDYVKTEKLLRQAVARDTTFAMAYRKLGVTLSNLGLSRASIDSALSRAYQYRDRLPERERYVTIATYFQTGPGFDRQKAAEAWQQALGIDSTEVAALVNLANNYRSRRQFARAESLYASVNNSARASQISWGNYAGTLMADGKVAAADSAYAEVRRRFPNAQSGQVAPGVMMYQRGQFDSVEAFWRARSTSSNTITKLNGLANLVSTTMLRGRLREAQRFAVEARAVNEARGVPKNPLADSINSATVQLWYFDNRDAAARALDVALAQAPLRNLPVEQRPYFTLATLYAMAGRVDRAKSLLAQVESDMHGTSMLKVEEPSRHAALAEIAISEHRPLDAVREIWRADSLPDGPVGDCVHCMDLDLGRAFDLANKPDSAIAHWEAYLNYPTHESNRDAVLLPGIHKRLGELYEAKGETPKAISHYMAFINLWKNADKELQPRVAEARTRVAALQKTVAR